MKTTIEIPDEIFHRARAAAAMRGESLQDFVTESLRVRLAQGISEEPTLSGWRRVFGQANHDEIAAIDKIISDEFETTKPEAWP